MQLTSFINNYMYAAKSDFIRLLCNNAEFNFINKQSICLHKFNLVNFQ